MACITWSLVSWRCAKGEGFFSFFLKNNNDDDVKDSIDEDDEYSEGVIIIINKECTATYYSCNR